MEPICVNHVIGDSLGMSSIAVETEGGWEECRLDNCNLMFNRYREGHKRYSLGDKIGVCPLCMFKRKTENGTLPKRDADMRPFVQHKGVEAKPESDSL